MKHLSGGGLLELKGLDGAGVFEGYASTFRNVDLQGDIVQPGAFARTIKEKKGVFPVLMAHDSGQVVGYGTHAEEDRKGLKVTGEFTLTNQLGLDAYHTVKHGAALGHKFGLSIGYYIPDGGASYDEKRGVRLLNDIDLMEFSLAATPANTQAGITSVKAAGELTKRELEAILRERCGLSSREAAALLSKGFEALGRDGSGSDDHATLGRDGSSDARRDGATDYIYARSGSVFAAEMRAVMLGR